MAFVNKQSGDEAQQDRAASGEPFEFDPNDPDVVKVHYDVAAWNFEQRAELSEALAEAELPHVWEGDEVVVPEVVEAHVDALFEELDKILGPFPIALDDDAESTEFGLDEWSDADRTVLTEALVASEVPHRWDGTTVVVAADAEHAVDDLLDAIEAGELLGDGGDAQSAPPEGALSTMFLAADRLAKDPMDAPARTDLLQLAPQLDAKTPPYGMAHRPWAGAVGAVDSIVGLIDLDAATGSPGDSAESDIIGAAQELRTLLRPYV
ncbi:MAG TPA: hypothetical protein VLN74_06700 [Ilumatobacteraceae bacterium]|nr:hypothetical protein [Ilumatobacteraceae bacterium]